MKNSLKLIERMVESVYHELKLVAADLPYESDKTYSILKEAIIDSIELKRKLKMLAVG